MVYFWGSTFRIKCTKVPLLLQAISYLGEVGRKSLRLKRSRRLWASKFLIKFHPTLSSFVKRQFLKIFVLMNNLSSSNLPRKKMSGERWREGGKKYVTDVQFTVNLRETDFRQTERNFTRPSYTCLKYLYVEWRVYRLNQNNPFKTAIFLLHVPRVSI